MSSTAMHSRFHEPHTIDEEHANAPHGLKEINPKMTSDIAYWFKQFDVTGDQLHESIRSHGTHVEKIRRPSHPQSRLGSRLGSILVNSVDSARRCYAGGPVGLANRGMAFNCWPSPSYIVTDYTDRTMEFSCRRLSLRFTLSEFCAPAQGRPSCGASTFVMRMEEQ
jgi:Protein of unknown function (DUF3606)